MRYYPSYVYSPREDVTRRNMQDYDEKMVAIEKKCLEIDPDYHKRNLREQVQLRNKLEENYR